MERARTATRVALRILGAREGRRTFVRRLLDDQDLLDSFIYAAGIATEDERPFLDFLRELIQTILSDPTKFIDLIITIIELFSAPQSVPEPPA